MNEVRDLAAEAKQVARRLHADHVDQAGQPYVGHLERVAQRVAERGGTEEQVAAAWLHDSVEDGKTTLAEIRMFFPYKVTRLVDAMTKREGENRKEYIRRLLKTEGAALIKEADHDDNMDEGRLSLLDPATRGRLKSKYTREQGWIRQGEVPA